MKRFTTLAAVIGSALALTACGGYETAQAACDDLAPGSQVQQMGDDTYCVQNGVAQVEITNEDVLGGGWDQESD